MNKEAGASDEHFFKRPQRKKRQASLNHLVNFTFADRPDIADIDTHEIIHEDTVSAYRPYKKEHFVNANFRFLLDPSGDYTPHLEDPDACFDWDLIEQVLVYATQISTCPICLDPPSVARIARCGHMFCLSCILHHFDVSGGTCPICWDAAVVKELRPIQTLPCVKYAMGKKIDLCLMRRPSNAMHAVPVSVTTTTVTPLPHDTSPHAIPYARFMLVTPHTLEKSHQADTAQLLESIDSCQDGDDELAALVASLDLLNHHHDRQRKDKKKSKRPHHPSSSHQLASSDYYFYQAEDGQWIFPGSRTIRMLLDAFGDYAHFPPKIPDVEITHFEEELLTEERRKRYKFLGHVPLGCNVAWIEVDLRGVVPDELLAASEPEAIEEQASPQEPILKEEWSDEEEMLEYVLKLSATQQ